MTLILTVILVALVFEYINGFHDTANSIATVVSTKVLTPRQAVILAAVTNLFGAMWGTAVAKTITSGLVDSKMVSMTSDIIICVLLGAIVWNLITWWFGLPSSSSHALIGGLCGAALAASHQQLARHHLVAAQRTSIGTRARACCGRSSCRCSSRRCSGSCSASSSWRCSILCLRNQRPAARQRLLWHGPDVQRRRHGFHARHQRRPENHGHHRPRAARRHQSRRISTVCRPGFPFCTRPNRTPGRIGHSRSG